jgi:hypothetical protein
VSNTDGIDFTDLGPLHGSKQDQASPNVQGSEKQDDLITIGFRVKPSEKAISAQSTVRIGSIFVNAPSSGETLTIFVNLYPPGRTTIEYHDVTNLKFPGREYFDLVAEF